MDRIKIVGRHEGTNGNADACEELQRNQGIDAVVYIDAAYLRGWLKDEVLQRHPQLRTAVQVGGSPEHSCFRLDLATVTDYDTFVSKLRAYSATLSLAERIGLHEAFSSGETGL